ncbi:hypothetical protein [Streptococcus pyogenes]|nr:hypothetical protein [Streptococcus pyogenes]VGZ29136.1 Uncharacterised protein [Streptococcus pyogenes]VHA12390.1 Uncharacterised protein [Streptococcus pyogenes]VHB88273.1 Uncharacterised protein [Streptococcus pyogenes]VHF12538.1 Uncharacterised protein [Streptococcus pyogenes]VHF96528.1 Uncharacterised protein [Streptococcus pyogenes]
MKSKRQAMFNSLQKAKDFAKTIQKNDLLCIKEPIVINNKLTHIVVYNA